MGSTGPIMQRSVYDADNDGVVDSASSVPVSGVSGLSEVLSGKIDMPAGGSTGQVLAKGTGGVMWVDQAGGGGGGSPVTGAEAVTLDPGSDATASLNGGILTIGVPRGSDGAPGTPGAAPVLSMGSVTTLPAGSSATAAMTSSGGSYTISLGIPRGSDGQGGGTGTVTWGGIQGTLSSQTDLISALNSKMNVPSNAGTSGQVLTKGSTGYSWQTVSGGGGSGSGDSVTAVTAIPSADAIGAGATGGKAYAYNGVEAAPSNSSPFYACDGQFAKTVDDTQSPRCITSFSFGTSYKKNKTYLTPKAADLALWSDVSSTASDASLDYGGFLPEAELGWRDSYRKLAALNSFRFGPFVFSRSDWTWGTSHQIAAYPGVRIKLSNGVRYFAMKTGTQTFGDVVQSDDNGNLVETPVHVFSAPYYGKVYRIETTSNGSKLELDSSAYLIANWLAEYATAPEEPDYGWGYWEFFTAEYGTCGEKQASGYALSRHMSMDFLPAASWDAYDDGAAITSIEDHDWTGLDPDDYDAYEAAFPDGVTVSVTCPDFTPGTYVPKVISDLKTALCLGQAAFQEALAEAMKDPVGFTMEVPFRKLDYPEAAAEDGQAPVYDSAAGVFVFGAVGSGTVTITQGGVSKGSFRLGQRGDTVIPLDAGSGGGEVSPITAVEAETLSPGSQATAMFSGGTLTLGIPAGSNGADGSDGTDGTTPVIQGGVATTVEYGSSPAVSVDSNGNTYTFNFSIPAGSPGTPGTPGTNGVTPVMSMAAATTLPAGSAATASMTSAGSVYTISLGIPRGSDGQGGGAGTVTWGGIQGTLANQTDLAAALNSKQDAITQATANTLDPGSAATVSIVGGVMTLGIPRGSNGQNGSTPILSMGNVATLDPGQAATATMTSAGGSYTISLGIPAGYDGDPGVPGDPGNPGADGVTPVLSMGPATTLDPGSAATATMTNVGSVYTISLGIPRGSDGQGGTPQTVTWGGIQGMLSSQTDLASALGSKQAVIDNSHKLDYGLLSNTPTIPTVNNPAVVISYGGMSAGSFTLNQSTSASIALGAVVNEYTHQSPKPLTHDIDLTAGFNPVAVSVSDNGTATLNSTEQNEGVGYRELVISAGTGATVTAGTSCTLADEITAGAVNYCCVRFEDGAASVYVWKVVQQ